MRSQLKLGAILFAVLSLGLQGCETGGFFFFFTLVTGAVPVVPKGNDVIVGTLFRHVQTTIPAGVASVSGKAASPNLNQAGLTSALPTQLRFRVQHKNQNNKVVQEFLYVVNVDSDGKVPAQKFDFPGMRMNPGETLYVSMSPVDADLPTDSLKLKLKYKASS